MTFRDRYKFDTSKDLIGKGGFARVYRAIDVVRKRIVALKVYHGVVSSKYDIISEINRMEDIVHPNLIRYYDANIIESTNIIGEHEQMQVGILEYANAGHIRQFFRQKKRGQTITKHIILGILEGLKFLHTKDIAHRDLKPKNILLSKKDGQLNAKIADFGISKKLSNDDEGMSSQLLGSVEYMAPEQFAPTLYGIDSKLQTNADLWSLGIIIYEIFMQKLPFGSRTQGINHEQILNKILFEELDPDYRSLPAPYNEIIGKCLVKKAGDRVQNAQVLIDILEGKKSNTSNSIPTPPSYNPNKGSSTKVINVNPDLENDPYHDGPTEEILKDGHQHQSNSEANTVADLPTINASPNQQPYDNNEGEKTQQLDEHKKSSWFKWGKSSPPKPKEEKVVKPVEQIGARSALHEINVGKNLFKLGNYPESFKILDRFVLHQAFDTEAKFFLGVMYYNGNCGGAHDVGKGKGYMQEAKAENRSLVQQLTIKYILQD